MCIGVIVAIILIAALWKAPHLVLAVGITVAVIILWLVALSIPS